MQGKKLLKRSIFVTCRMFAYVGNVWVRRNLIKYVFSAPTAGMKILAYFSIPLPSFVIGQAYRILWSNQIL